MTAGTVHIVQSLFRPHVRRDLTDEFREGETVRAVAVRHLDPAWGEDPDVALVLNGRKLTEETELDAPIPANADLVVMPEVAREWVPLIGGLVVGLVLGPWAGYATYFALSMLLAKKAKPPARGDIVSPTYSWDGIQTNRGPGFRIPIAYGIIRVGGQVIATNFYERGIGDEVVVMQIVLSEGPIARIGGYDLTSRTDVNNLGGLKNPNWNPASAPTGIRLNGSNINTKDAWIHLRAGTLHQTPVPGMIRGTTVIEVQKQLKYGFPQLHGVAPDVVTLRVRVRFDALFQQVGNNAAPYSVDFFSIFLDASGNPLPPSVKHTVTGTSRSPFHYTFIVPVLQGIPNIQLQFARGTPDDAPGGDTVSTATWAQVVEEIPALDIAYIGRASLTLELRSSEQFQGTATNVTVPIWGKLVRWKKNGVWQLPSFFDATTNTWPGRNPAWVAYDYLTSRRGGLGKFFRAAMIDEVSLELWAEWCAQLVSDGNGGMHPRHQFDGVIDRGDPAWDVFLAICRAGRCVPWPFADLVTFKFEHPDVAGFERPVVQVFAESNIENLQISYADRRSLPTIYDAQILDEALEWEQNTISQESPYAFGLNEPWKVGATQPRRELIDFFGITRAAHVRRELLWMHGVNSLYYSRVDFVVGIDAFAVEVGDVIAIQHDVPQWFDTPTHGFRTPRGVTAEANIYLDYPIVLAAGKSYEVMISRPDTTPQLVTVIAGPGGYAPDQAIAIASAQTYLKGAVVALGEVGKSTVKYQVVSLALEEQMKFRVSAVIYDEASFQAEATVPLGEDYSLVSDAVAIAETSIAPVTEPSMVLVAAHGTDVAVSWVYPPQKKGPARVYVRSKVPQASAQDPSVDQQNLQRWELVYEGQGTEVTV